MPAWSPAYSSSQQQPAATIILGRDRTTNCRPKHCVRAATIHLKPTHRNLCMTYTIRSSQRSTRLQWPRLPPPPQGSSRHLSQLRVHSVIALLLHSTAWPFSSRPRYCEHPAPAILPVPACDSRMCLCAAAVVRQSNSGMHMLPAQVMHCQILTEQTSRLNLPHLRPSTQHVAVEPGRLSGRQTQELRAGLPMSLRIRCLPHV